MVKSKCYCFSKLKSLKKMLKMLVKKIPDDSEFFETQDFKKVNFNAKMVKPSKKFVDENQTETSLVLGDKNREKNRKTSKF